MKCHRCYFTKVHSRVRCFGGEHARFMSRDLFGLFFSVLYVESRKLNRALLDEMAPRCAASAQSAGVETLTNVTYRPCHMILKGKTLKNFVYILDVFLCVSRITRIWSCKHNWAIQKDFSVNICFLQSCTDFSATDIVFNPCLDQLLTFFFSNSSKDLS